MECSQSIFIVSTILLAVTLANSCPIGCICKWKGGKEYVECANKDLLMLPEGLDPKTQVLNFTGNNLQTLQRERFQKMELTNLQRIYLSRCRLTGIDDRAFTGLTNLIELDLSENLLTSVPTESFADYTSLMKLILSNNPISVLHRNAFQHLSYLNTLEISNCDIELIEDEAFIGLDNLEWLRLDGNKLTTIRGQHILPEMLHGIDLTKNNWQCDCRLLDLQLWLHSFNNIPHTVEPTCNGPPRLAGRNIRSIDVTDFACLPDVSPTTLYLEIGEGKNVSLLCKVNAVPEAQVSWWFQGQVLQNDSMIAPGLHLYYYIEEGTEEKRSELFIYNTNPEDNGTFICVAENSAGKTQSNFTIRIIVKEEPIMTVVTFPPEYLMAVYAGLAALIIIVIPLLFCYLVKCRKSDNRKEKKERTKEVALHATSNNSKCSVMCEDIEATPEPVKINKNIITSEPQQQVTIFIATPNEEIINSVTSASCSTQFRSPPSARNYPTDQNPDLINDTESVGKTRRKEGDGEDDRESCTQTMSQEILENVVEEIITGPAVRQVHWKDLQFPVRIAGRQLYQHAADIHLNPVCLLGTDDYPPDYGLPKGVLRPQLSSDHVYRTLPHNRTAKRLSAANPHTRYSREAEFLSRTSQQPASYEHYYTPDVRYTVDGYPRALPADGLYATDVDINFIEGTFVPSPPDPYKTDAPASLPCCISPAPKLDGIPTAISETSGQWPACLPVGLHMPSHDNNQSRFATISKRCVSAQTESGDDKSFSRQTSIDKAVGSESVDTSKTQNGIDSSQHQPIASSSGAGRVGTIKESPDEGYVGEGTDSAEI